MSQYTTTVPDAQVVADPFQESASSYRSAGWLGTVYLPVGMKANPPTGYTGYDGLWPTDSQVNAWHGNIGLRLPENVIGIDVDQYEKNGKQKNGARQLAGLEDRLGKLPGTWSSTRRGPGESRIRFYRVPDGRRWPTKAASDIEIIQFGHRYAVVWPSRIAEDDQVYRWYLPNGEPAAEGLVPSPSDLTELPSMWADNPEAWNWATSGTSGGITSTEVAGRATSALLNLWPDDPGRGHDWLVRAAGELLAIMGGRMSLTEEYALGILRGIDAISSSPHPETVLLQTWDSVKRIDARNHGPIVATAPPPNALALALSDGVVKEFAESSGYLRSREEGFGYETLINNRLGKPETVEFSDFLLQAKTVHSQDGATTWTVDIRRSDGTVVPDVELTSDTLASHAALLRWALGYRCAIRFSASDKRGPTGTRLLALLESQNPIECEVVEHLGWNEKAGVFVTEAGVITPGQDKIQPYTRVRPSKFAQQHSRSHYGTAVTTSEAVEVLKEVLTFHEETAASVVGAWAVMAVLRGHLSASVFPTLKVDGSAESGKSKFLQQIFGLVGATGTGGGWTKATARSALGANSSGIVWFDDCDGLTNDIQELLRQAATGGDATNRDVADLSKLQVTKFRASAAISSEGLGDFFNSQKANRDRVVAVHFPDPKGRRSFKNPERPQWDDVVDLWINRFDSDFTQLSGSLVSVILQHAHMLSEMKGLNKTSSRKSQSDSILVMGARILAAITGDQFHIERIDRWIESQEDLGNASVTILQILPTLWRDNLMPAGVGGNGIVHSVYRDTEADGGHFWVSAVKLSDQWLSRHGNDARQASLTSAAAITAELDNIGCGPSMKKRTGADGSNNRLRYRKIPERYTEGIMNAALGSL